MQPRRLVVVAVFWATLTVGANLIGAGWLAPQRPEPKPFLHSQHVGAAWVGGAPEVFRDCRGCHRFSADDKFSSPQRVCNDCHTGGGELALDADPGWERDLSPRSSRTGPAFRHHTHGMLECRQCHEDKAARGRTARTHIPITTGPAFCGTCHDTDVAAEEVAGFRWYQGVLAGVEGAAERAEACGLTGAFPAPATAAERAAYAKKLHAVFAGRDGGINTTPLATGGKFDHGDHIGGNDPIACKTCHSNVRTAKASEVGTGRIPTDGCERCHIRDADGARAREAEDSLRATRPQWSLGAFAHVDHYPVGGARKEGVARADSYEQIAAKDCEACHTYAPENPGFSERDFPFNGEASRHRYQDCRGCHDGAAWSTGEGQGSLPALHSSNGGDGWQDCAACHVLGEPDLKALRPTEVVQRWTQRTFVFEGQTHPHITTAGTERVVADGGRSLQQDCATCHRAKVRSLPTRLIEKQFRHATHLPAEPKASDCTTCHTTATTSGASATMTVESFRTYDLRACSTCHWGGDVREQVAEQEQPAGRDVVSFPHKAHVDAGAKCADCHTLASSGADMETAPKIANCTECHKHELVDGGRPVAERLVRQEVESCAKCHHEDGGDAQVASVPSVAGSERARTDPRYEAQQLVFAGFRDSQFHPLDRACTDCHTVTDKQGAFSPIVVNVFGREHLRGSATATVHADPPRGFGAGKPEDCLRCHWKGVNGYDNYFSDREEGLRALRKRPASAETRARFGDAFEGFPGTEKAKG